ncbi:DUF5777 family beta-barrel protein [Flectobacillus rivi]|uniref:DUF5777 family beta-barrel protein n=1 Tax=Flectobacillus rivi TaxID=2984209 RepID=A0ABT6Z687_9BACT|nr:DUF5777 family beta-barrel protein [Flectobacillus rivi]MDI9876645.1 DUF5777 family beta-barrel protein [Flectobacillus rivi]
MVKKICFWVCCLGSSQSIAQSDNLLNLVQDTDSIKTEYVTNAFKSSRVINNQSIEMIGKGVLDFRILHRFGLLNSGISNFYGFDQASFRLGFDYGITQNLSIGVGRSTYQKELDGSIKWRILQQTQGRKEQPFSLVWVSGVTLNTTPAPSGEISAPVSDRSGYYHELLIGRKFNENFSFQLNPILVHRNRIQPTSSKDDNNVVAIGFGLRMKLSRRIAFVADYDYVISGLNKEIFENPLAIGFDIETGGHVFQLHFSNTVGMNENAFLTKTTNQWGKGAVNFGFNLSRVFSIRKKKIS